MSFTGGGRLLIEADDTQGQQNPDGDGDHTDPGWKARHLLQNWNGRQGRYNRYGRKKDRRHTGADMSNGNVEAGYAQHTGNQTLVSALEQNL
mgnify:CR=1 FL=1